MRSSKQLPPLKTYADFRRLCDRRRCGFPITSEEYVEALGVVLDGLAFDFQLAKMCDLTLMREAGQHYLIRLPMLHERYLLGQGLSVVVRCQDGALVPLSKYLLDALHGNVPCAPDIPLDVTASFLMNTAEMRQEHCFRVAKALNLC